MGTTILAGWRMRERLSRRTNECARRLETHAQRDFARSLWALVSRLVSKMCAMDNTDRVLSYSCYAILRVYELSARAAGANACAQVRAWPHGAPELA